MPDLNDLPEPLQHLISEMIDAVVDITGELELDLDYVVQWQAEMERLLARYHTAAYMAGQDSAILAATDLAWVQQVVASQISFLDNFATIIADSAEFEQGWKSRAIMYAEATQQSFWGGKFAYLPLPSLPGDGTTTCLSRCRCKWHIDEIDADRGSWDAYWRRNAKDSCQICIQRAADWNPLQIRNGELVI